MATSLPPDVISATVVASMVDTPYQAAGRGASLLALSTSSELQRAFLRHSPRHIRVLAPALNDGEGQLNDPEEFAEWLVNFLDALGIERTALVADGSVTDCVVHFARRYPARVTQTVLLESQAEGAASAWRANERVASRQPLVLRWEDSGVHQPATVSRVISELITTLEPQKPPGS